MKHHLGSHRFHHTLLRHGITTLWLYFAQDSSRICIPHVIFSGLKIYSLIIWSPKFCSFIIFFSTTSCTHFHTRTIIDSNFYCNAQNIIHFCTFLLKITEFWFARVLCLRVLKLPPVWFQNHTNVSSLCYPLCYPACSRFFRTSIINPTNPYKNYSLWFWKMLVKQPTNQTSIEFLCILYVIKHFRIGMMIEGSGIQWISEPDWKSSLAPSVSLGGNYYINIKQWFITIPNGNKLNKEILILILFGCACAPFRIGREIHFLER